MAPSVANFMASAPASPRAATAAGPGTLTFWSKPDLIYLTLSCPRSQALWADASTIATGPPAELMFLGTCV